MLAIVRSLLLVAPVAAFVSSAGADEGTSREGNDLDDAAVTRALESEFLFDEAVQLGGVDVTTQAGVVTLGGTVDNLLARERALRLAEATKGVRAVVDRIQVKPRAPRGDAELRKAVKDALLADPVAESFEIEVAASDGVVTLEGDVDSWQERSIAGEVAKGVRGAVDLRNQLGVRPPDRPRPPGEIEAEVRRRLASDVWVDAALVRVDVQEDGRVHLRGTVGSAAEKSRAYTLAWVGGVTGVDHDALEVRWWARDEERAKRPATRSDEELREAVKAAFLYDPRVSSFEPIVTVRDGHVTLSGIVTNLEAKRAAEQDARNTVGVWGVRNLLRVRSPLVPSDAELERRIGSSLEADPYLERHEIGVSVHGGFAYLTGGVDSEFERDHAGNVIAGVRGLTGFRNYLRVEEDFAWRSDRELEQDIESELFWSPFVDADQVRVSVDDGVATLTGTVDSWFERSSATENAREAGARRVDNDLHVAGVPPAITSMP